MRRTCACLVIGRSCSRSIIALRSAIATFALKAGVWFRRGRLLIVSPDSLGTACPLSGRNSTYRPVQILEASSEFITPIDWFIPLRVGFLSFTVPAQIFFGRVTGSAEKYLSNDLRRKIEEKLSR